MVHCAGGFNATQDGSSALSDVEFHQFLKEDIIYIVTSVFTLLGNFLILLSVGANKKLREKYFLVLTLAGGDMCNGLGFLLSGALRLRYVINGSYNNKVSQFDCMLRPFIWFFVLGNHIPILVTLIITIERFFVIIYSTLYVEHQVIIKRYIRIAETVSVACVYVEGLCVLGVGLGVWGVGGDGSCVDNLCFVAWALGPLLSGFYYGLTIVAGTCSILLYLAAVVNMKRLSRSGGSGMGVVSRIFNKRQRRVTRMMLIVVVLTFVTVVLPTLGLYLPDALSVPIFDYATLAPYFGAVFCLNSGITVVVYAVTNPELRMAFKKSLCLCAYSDDTNFSTQTFGQSNTNNF